MWALGLAKREAHRCPRGHDLAESLDPEWKWVPLPPLVCNACVAEQASAEKHQNDVRARAMLHRVQKVPRPPKPKKKRGR